MGNSAGGFRLLRNGDSSYNFQLGKSVSINIKEGQMKWEDNGILSQTWEATYNVEGLTCTLSLVKTPGNNSDDKLEIQVKDSTYRQKINHNEIDEYSSSFSETVRRAEEAALLDVTDISCSEASYKTFRGGFNTASLSEYIPYTRKTINSSGGVTLTTLCTYGSGTRKGLYVSEWKKRNENEKPYVGTVAHYYANISGEYFRNASRTDIGLSIVAKIRVSEYGKLDFTVDGPVQHPSSALFYMFEEVDRTGTWTLTACPHCANLQRQRRWTPWQSEDEDSDGIPAAPGYGRRQNARNNGQFLGNANGSFFEKNILVFPNGRC